MKLRTPTKFAIAFVVVVAALTVGYRTLNAKLASEIKLGPIGPGKVNVVGIDPGAGYQIIVANQMAQLVVAEGSMESNDKDGGEGPSSSIKKRIPIREMLGSINGDPQQIGEFVRIMNDIKQDEGWPTSPTIWTMEDVEKAIGGDATLKTKLERDINMHLTGAPLDSVRPQALFNGILVDFPIKLTIKSTHGIKEVVGRMQLPYRPKLMKIVEEKISDKNADMAILRGFYADEAKKELDDLNKQEKVVDSIRHIYSDSHVRSLAEPAERVLGSAEVIINQDHILGAESTEYDAGEKKRYDIKVQLTDEGQKRLWKYSRDRVGTHVMLIVDGIAVAAPKISHELTQDELTISRMEDPVMVREAVDALNKSSKK